MWGPSRMDSLQPWCTILQCDRGAWAALARHGAHLMAVCLSERNAHRGLVNKIHRSITGNYTFVMEPYYIKLCDTDDSNTT